MSSISWRSSRQAWWSQGSLPASRQPGPPGRPWRWCSSWCPGGGWCCCRWGPACSPAAPYCPLLWWRRLDAGSSYSETGNSSGPCQSGDLKKKTGKEQNHRYSQQHLKTKWYCIMYQHTAIWWLRQAVTKKEIIFPFLPHSSNKATRSEVPGQMRYVISPAYSGTAPGPRSSWTCPLPQGRCPCWLPSTGSYSEQLYSKLHLGVRDP